MEHYNGQNRRNAQKMHCALEALESQKYLLVYALSMKRLRLLYLADCVSSHSTKGDFIHVKEVLEAFVRKCHNLTLLIRGKEIPKFLENHIYTLKLPDPRFPLSFLVYAISALTITIETLAKKPNAIYVRDNGINLGVTIGKILRTPVILEVNGDLFLEYSLKNKALAQILKLAMRITYPLADAIIIPSKGQLSILKPQKVNPNKVYVIPNAVNPQKFHLQNKAKCRQKLKLTEDSFYFCFVGNLAPWQGLDYAITALSKLIGESKDPKIKLIVIGDGPVKEKLQTLANKLNIKNNIIFLGAVDHENIPCIINACDVCIAPFTAWRNKKIGVSPLKLYEYLSCGKPVIASKVPGTKIISELDAGILVEPDNVEELKKAYKEAIKKLSYWEKKAHIIHKEIAINHSWDSRVDTILKIIQQIIHRKHKFSN